MAFLGFQVACASANHSSFHGGSGDSLKNPLCCGVCVMESLCSRERVKVGVLRPLSSPVLPSSTQPPAGLGSALPEPSETCVTLLGGLWPEPHPPQGRAPLPLPARNSSPSSADNRGVLQTLEACKDLKTQEAPKRRPFNRRQSEAAFVSKSRGPERRKEPACGSGGGAGGVRGHIPISKMH